VVKGVAVALYFRVARRGLLMIRQSLLPKGLFSLLSQEVIHKLCVPESKVKAKHNGSEQRGQMHNGLTAFADSSEEAVLLAKVASSQWLMPVILVTWGAEIRRIEM
jgi:hypothetical protein